MVFDGISFFRDFNITYYTESKNASYGWISLRCPFHNDHGDHLGFNPVSGAVSCWICGRHSALDLVRVSLNVPRSEAMGIYSRYLKKGGTYSVQERRKRAGATGIELPGKGFTRAEIRYLQVRALYPLVDSADLRSGGRAGEWAYRIVIPIYFHGNIVSATGRSISSGLDPKYWTLPLDKEVVHHKHIFYGFDKVDDIAAPVEGPIDAIRGGAGFISSFGVSMTDEQKCLLLAVKKVIYIKDADEAGEKYYNQAYELSALGHKDVEIVSLGNGYKDIGEMPEDEILDVRKELGLGKDISG